ncbi:MAG TPA: response regulator [Thermoanaerobaculia bacterium]|nr:response regulator [Thermoanaerobaculia bacterium]
MSPAEQRVLIAEDDPSIRNLVRDALTRAGLECDAVSDGLEAVEHLTRSRYSVLLLDLMMPRLDGISALKQVAPDRWPANRSPIVLIMTASTDLEPIAEMSEVVHMVIRKPFDILELAEIIRECVAFSADGQRNASAS